MSRGESYGGGQSSLGYLFGGEAQQDPPAASPKIQPPPYGIDTDADNYNAKPTPITQSPLAEQNCPRGQGLNSANFLTDRPSTKVKSVPGGDSSLGYLFGDK